MKNIYLLGATGSIGTQTLELIEEYNYNLVAFSFGYNTELAKTIIEKYSPQVVSTIEEETAMELKGLYPNIEIVFGEEGLDYIASLNGNDGILVNALVGFVGLKPTITGIKSKKVIAIANKETLVVAGDIIMPMVKEENVELIPIDSEHSAILQAIGSSDSEVRRVIITASGGSFRDLSREELANVTVEDALNHPNWSMGSKITIDSATMMNKGFEVIEAHQLFGLDYSQIDTIIHKESIVHAMVEFVDGSIISQMGEPTMKLPILYALNYPDHVENDFASDLNKFENLSFKEMDMNRFPLLKLAYEVGEKGGLLPCVLNASNEAAVSLFLDGKISFLDIERIIETSVNSFENSFDFTLEDLFILNDEIKSKIIEEYTR